MKTLTQRVVELRGYFEEILRQFRLVDAATVNGPHAELSLQELRLVEYLGSHEPPMMRELAEFLLLAVNSVTSTVDNLEKKGLVTRQRSSQDRRIVRVELTAMGQQVYQSANREKHETVRGMLEALTDEEQEQFIALTRKIARPGWKESQKTGATD